MTHKTKKGFGSLLNEGIKCKILSANTDNSVFVETDNGSFVWGKLSDLQTI